MLKNDKATLILLLLFGMTAARFSKNIFELLSLYPNYLIYGLIIFAPLWYFPLWIKKAAQIPVLFKAWYGIASLYMIICSIIFINLKTNDMVFIMLGVLCLNSLQAYMLFSRVKKIEKEEEFL